MGSLAERQRAGLTDENVEVVGPDEPTTPAEEGLLFPRGLPSEAHQGGLARLAAQSIATRVPQVSPQAEQQAVERQPGPPTPMQPTARPGAWALGAPDAMAEAARKQANTAASGQIAEAVVRLAKMAATAGAGGAAGAAGGAGGGAAGGAAAGGAAEAGAGTAGGAASGASFGSNYAAGLQGGGQGYGGMLGRGTTGALQSQGGGQSKDPLAIINELQRQRATLDPGLRVLYGIPWSA